MVRVQQNRGLSCIGHPARDDSRSSGGAVVLIAAQDPHVLNSGGAHQGSDGLGAAVQRGGIETGPGDAREPDEVFQVADRGVKGFMNGPAQGIDVGYDESVLDFCGISAVKEVMAKTLPAGTTTNTPGAAAGTPDGPPPGWRDLGQLACLCKVFFRSVWT